MIELPMRGQSETPSRQKSRNPCFSSGVNILIHSPLNTRFPQQQGHDVDLVVFSIDSVP